MPANEITLNRLNELEREKEALKYQVHQLLGKLQQVRIIRYEVDNLNFIHFLQVQSILSRVREVIPLPFPHIAVVTLSFCFKHEKSLRNIFRVV